MLATHVPSDTRPVLMAADQTSLDALVKWDRHGFPLAFVECCQTNRAEYIMPLPAVAPAARRMTALVLYLMSTLRWWICSWVAMGLWLLHNHADWMGQPAASLCQAGCTENIRLIGQPARSLNSIHLSTFGKESEKHFWISLRLTWCQITDETAKTCRGVNASSCKVSSWPTLIWELFLGRSSVSDTSIQSLSLLRLPTSCIFQAGRCQYHTLPNHPIAVSFNSKWFQRFYKGRCKVLSLQRNFLELGCQVNRGFASLATQ